MFKAHTVNIQYYFYSSTCVVDGLISIRGIVLKEKRGRSKVASKNRSRVIIQAEFFFSKVPFYESRITRETGEEMGD
jgi:hypothetical protein